MGRNIIFNKQKVFPFLKQTGPTIDFTPVGRKGKGNVLFHLIQEIEQLCDLNIASYIASHNLIVIDIDIDIDSIAHMMDIVNI